MTGSNLKVNTQQPQLYFKSDSDASSTGSGRVTSDSVWRAPLLLSNSDVSAPN